MYSHTAHVSIIYHILDINEQSIIKKLFNQREKLARMDHSYS